MSAAGYHQDLAATKAAAQVQPRHCLATVALELHPDKAVPGLPVDPRHWGAAQLNKALRLDYAAVVRVVQVAVDGPAAPTAPPGAALLRTEDLPPGGMNGHGDLAD